MSDLDLYEIQFTDNTAEEGAEARRQVQAMLDVKNKAMALACEAIDLALNWDSKTQSDEYLIETRLKEALEELRKVMQ